MKAQVKNMVVSYIRMIKVFGPLRFRNVVIFTSFSVLRRKKYDPILTFDFLCFHLYCCDIVFETVQKILDTLYVRSEMTLLTFVKGTFCSVRLSRQSFNV